jgi:hypothetical protein
MTSRLTRAAGKVATAVNTVLRPFGLALWLTYDIDEDDRGHMRARIVGASIGKRPVIRVPE